MVKIGLALVAAVIVGLVFTLILVGLAMTEGLIEGMGRWGPVGIIIGAAAVTALIVLLVGGVRRR